MLLSTRSVLVRREGPGAIEIHHEFDVAARQYSSRAWFSLAAIVAADTLAAQEPGARRATRISSLRRSPRTVA